MISDCATEWSKYRCSFEHSHPIKVSYNSCGHRGICPRDSMNYAHKRAGLLYQMIKRNIADKFHYDFDLKMNQIVLTLPDELNSTIETKLFTKMIHKFMVARKIESWGYVIQYWHSDNPLCERFVHAHILTLNIVRQGNRIANADYWFNVSDMRKQWKDIIKEFTGVEVEGDVNLHTEYASVLDDKEQVLHLLTYVYRYPIEDLFKVLIRDKSIDYLYYVQSEQIEKNEDANLHYFCTSCYEHIKGTDTERLQHCRYLRHNIEDAWDQNWRPENPSSIVQFDLAKKIEDLVNSKPRLVWCGLLTSAKRALLQSLLNSGSSQWQNLTDIEYELDMESKNCSICHSPLETRPFDTGPYTGDNEPLVIRYVR